MSRFLLTIFGVLLALYVLITFFLLATGIMQAIGG